MDKAVKDNRGLPYIKGIGYGVAISIAGVLLLALVYRMTAMSDITIKIINQIIKVLSIFVGVMVCMKGDRSKGLIKGGVVGLCYTLVTYIVFSLLSSSFSFGLNFIFDMIFGVIMGCICGVIGVNGKN